MFIILLYLVTVLIARRFNVLVRRIDSSNVMMPIVWFIPFGFIAYGLYYVGEKNFKLFAK